MDKPENSMSLTKTQRFFNFVGKSTKACDIHGVPISLNFKGEDKFKTFIGGLVSIIEVILIALFCLYQVSIIINSEKTNLSTSTISTNQILDPTIVSVSEMGFSFGIMGSKEYGPSNILNDPDYFKIEIGHILWEDPTEGSSPIYTDLGTTSCANKGKEFDSIRDIEFYNLDQWICPKSDNYTIGGTFGAPRYDYAVLRVRKWHGSPTWKTDEEINTELEGLNIALGTTEYYFQYEKNTDPIDVNIKMQGLYPTLPGYQIIKEVFTEINTVDDHNNLFYPDSKKTYTYPSVQKINQEIAVETENEQGEKLVVEFIIRLSSDLNYIERRYYTFYDALSNIGGIISIVFALGSGITWMFSHTIYYMTLLSSFYQVEYPPNEGSSKTHSKHLQEESKVAPKVGIENRGRLHKAGAVKRQSLFQFQLQTKESVLKRIQEKLSKYSWYKFKWKNMWYANFMWYLCDCKRKRGSPLFTDFNTYKTGKEKIIKELDLMSILDSVRKTNVLCNTLLSRHQQILVELQPLNQAKSDKSRVCEYPKVDQKPISKLLEELGEYYEDVGIQRDNMVDKRLMAGILLSELSLKHLNGETNFRSPVVSLQSSFKNLGDSHSSNLPKNSGDFIERQDTDNSHLKLFSEDEI